MLREKKLALAEKIGKLERKPKVPVYKRIFNYFRKQYKIRKLDKRISVLEKKIEQYVEKYPPIRYVSKYNHSIAPSQMKTDIVK